MHHNRFLETKEDIETSATEEDKPVLLWLLLHYRDTPYFSLVADYSYDRYCGYSNRVWFPTPEGRVLYEARDRLHT